MLVHTVVFWLKSDLSNEEKEQFFEGVKSLGRIPSVDSFHVGTPANTPKRPVIDDSYDCCLSVILRIWMLRMNTKSTLFIRNSWKNVPTYGIRS